MLTAKYDEIIVQDSSDQKNSSAAVENLRHEISHTDAQILSLIAKRLRIAKDIGKLKAERGMNVGDPQVETKVLANNLEIAQHLNLPRKLVASLTKDLIAWSRVVQGPSS